MNAHMAKMSLSLRKVTGWVVGGAVLGTTLMTPGVAQADESTPTGKGIAGGVLLGGEIVMSLEAAFNVSSPTAYALGALGGGLAGGVGGYFVEQNVSSAKIPSYMLAAGVAFLVPATVLAFNATSYKPPSDYQEDKGASGAEPAADVPTASPPPGSGAATPPTQGPLSQYPTKTPVTFRYRTLVARPLPPPTSMVAYQANQLRFSLPAVEVRPVFSPEELRQYGMTQREEVRVPVFQARF